jgi:predicted PurR-regulated permease PerM
MPTPPRPGHAGSEPSPVRNPPGTPQVRVEVNPTNDWRRLHLWHIQPLRDALFLVAIVGIVWLGDRLSIVTVPMLLALLFSYLFEPLVRFLTRKRYVSREGAAIAIIALGAIVVVLPVVLGGLFAGGQALRLVQNTTANAQRLWDSVTHWNDPAKRERVPAGLWRNARDSMVEERAWRMYESLLSPEAKHLLLDLSPEAHGVQFISRTDAESQGWPLPPPIESATPPLRGEFEIARAIPLPETRPSSPDTTPERSHKTALAPSPPTFAFVRPADIVRTTPPLGEARTKVSTLTSEVMRVIEWGVHWFEENQEALQRRAIAGSSAAVGLAANTLNSILATVGNFAFATFLTAFFFFFFCTGWGKVLEFWEGLIPEKRRGRIIDLLSQMDRVIAGFVRGRLVICGIMILVYTLGYLVVGVPAWLIVGPIVGILTLVPYAAGVFAPVAMLLMALDTSGPDWQNSWWWSILAPLLVLTASQLLDDYVLTPKIQGQATGMDTPTIVFASIAGGALAGVYGLLIAIPFFACIKILLREVVWPRFRAWSEGRVADPLPLDHDTSDP